jgi:type IX secretion system PorP/SprF family membrane protein
LEKKLPQKNVLATSAMVLRDQTMGGAFNSTYASLNLAYHIGLDAEGLQKIGFGLGGIYAHRRIDYNLLNFPQQFTSGGFDTNLPTGETGFANIKPFVSMSTGIMYSFTSEDHGTNFDIGVAAFHLNKPQQTAYEDQNQYIQPRYTVYGTYSSFLSDRASMSLNGIYQNQQTTEFWQFGGVLGMLLDNSNEPPVFNLGVWYRNQDAVIPYIGFSTKLFESVAQVGISYDVTVSQFKNARIKPQTLELSLILRSSRPDGSVPCPWK